MAIAAVAGGARSFTAIGQWAADADADTLAALECTGLKVASESAIRRTFARLDATVLDSVLAAWLWTRTRTVGARRVIAIDGKTVRGARPRGGNDALRRIWWRRSTTSPAPCSASSR